LKIFLIISAVLLFLIFIILFSKLSGVIIYDDKDKLRIIIKFLFFKIKVFPVSPKKQKKSETKDKTDENLDVISSVKKAVFHLTDFIKIIKHKLTISDFKLTAEIGTGDAAQTAILCGTCYAAVYSVLGPLQNIFIINPPQILINPVYNGKTAKVEYSGKISARVITYIVIAIKALAVILKKDKT